MTNTEQKEFDRLREQLESAQGDTDQVKAYFNNVLSRLTEELRLYRGLFWCMLTFALVIALVHLVQR